MKVTLRPRRGEDLPLLLEALAAQQPATGYPQSPTEVATTFIARDGELATFVADLGGRPVGHLSVQDAQVVDHDEEGAVLAAWERGYGRAANELGVLSALFVAPEARGHGIGAALLEAGIEWCQREGLAPCLDIVPNRSRALDLYRARGWRTVAEVPTRWIVPGSPLVHVMVLEGWEP